MAQVKLRVQIVLRGVSLSWDDAINFLRYESLRDAFI